MTILDLIKKKSPRLLINVEGDIAEKYEYLMEFLSSNREALGAIAEIEQLYYGGNPLSMGAVKSRYVELTAATRKLVEALNGVSGGKYAKLTGVYERIHEEIVRNFSPEPAGTNRGTHSAPRGPYPGKGHHSRGQGHESRRDS